jgi:chemotaxis protein histidine kinase CheA
MFQAAHDIKGEAATLGYPHVETIAECLCRLLDHARDKSAIPLALIDRHIEGVHAIKNCKTRLEANAIAEPLMRELSEATARHLMQEDIVALGELDVVSPPLAP